MENAEEVDKWLNKNKDIKSIILVSSYYHLPRCIMIFEKKISSKVKIYPKPVVQNVNFRNQFFFHLRLIISEYFKVIYTTIFIIYTQVIYIIISLIKKIYGELFEYI